MGTQHPDNVRMPSFLGNGIGDAGVFSRSNEITEALWFYRLGGDEQMWDFEGKIGDNQVVRELLTKDEKFFREHPLGIEKFLTLRISNPAIEKDEAKALVEVLESVAKFSDIASSFYEKDSVPVFEVILPMTTSAHELDRIYYFYKILWPARKLSAMSGDVTMRLAWRICQKPSMLYRFSNKTRFWNQANC
jgi:phosphoenolpyruvate carboxylase